jgi:hypothetical protein
MSEVDHQSVPTRQHMLDREIVPRIILDKYTLCDVNSFPYNLCCFALDKDNTGCSFCFGLIAVERPTRYHSKELCSSCECCRCYDWICDCDCFACDFSQCDCRWRSGKCCSVLSDSCMNCLKCCCETGLSSV